MVRVRKIMIFTSWIYVSMYIINILIINHHNHTITSYNRNTTRKYSGTIRQLIHTIASYYHNKYRHTSVISYYHNHIIATSLANILAQFANLFIPSQHNPATRNHNHTIASYYHNKYRHDSIIIIQS